LDSRELGIRPGDRVCFINPPVGFTEAVSPLPDGATLVRPDADSFDFAVLFSKSTGLLEERFESVRSRLSPRGSLWLGWLDDPASSDLDLNKIQAAGLSAGMVDNQLGELDSQWNGMRFVVRSQNRSSWPQ
jgi:hypothetical protein